MDLIAAWFRGSSDDDDDKQTAKLESDEPRQLVNLTGHTVHLCRRISGSRFYEVYATLEAGAGPVPHIEEEPADVTLVESVTIGDTTWDVPVFDHDSDAFKEVVVNLREERPNTTLVVSARVHALCNRDDLKHPITLDRDLLQDRRLINDSPDIYCIGFASDEYS